MSFESFSKLGQNWVKIALILLFKYFGTIQNFHHLPGTLKLLFQLHSGLGRYVFTKTSMYISQSSSSKHMLTSMLRRYCLELSKFTRVKLTRKRRSTEVKIFANCVYPDEIMSHLVWIYNFNHSILNFLSISPFLKREEIFRYC